MPLRSFRVKFKDGTSETVQADSLDQAWSKARRSANKQISVKQQGRKKVDSVHASQSKRGQQHHSFFSGFGSSENPANYTHFGKRNKGGTV